MTPCLRKLFPLFTPPLEHALLAALRARLSAPAAAILDRRLAALHHARRSADGCEVNYWPRSRHGKPYWDPSLDFPARAEIRLATLCFRLAGKALVYQSRFELIHGHFFTLNLRPGVRSLWKEREIEVVDFTLHHDPMQPSRPRPEVPRLKTLPADGLLGEWSARFPVSEVLAPLPQEDSRTILAEWKNTPFPPEYLGLMTQCDGLAVGSVGILGLSELRNVSLTDADYLPLLDLGGEASLGIPAEGETQVGPILYFLPHDGSPPEALRGTFRSEVEACFERAM